MSDFNRRKFSRLGRHRRRGRAGRRRRLRAAGACADADLQAREGRQAARAALEPLRAGRHRRLHGERQEVHREDRHRGARRQRGLGRRAAQGGGGRQHRRRPRHHPVDQRRRQPVPGQAARRHRPVPSTSARSTAAGTRPCEAYLQPDGKKWIGLPLGSPARCMVYRESMLKAAGFDSVPEGHRRLPQAVQGAEGEGHAAAASRWATPPATARWTHWLIWAFGGKLVDKNNKVVIDSPETLKALEYAKELYADLHPRHAVVARPEQQQGLPRRPDQRHQQRHLDLLRGQELAPIRRSRSWPPTSTTPSFPSARWACRPSRTCSSTR